MGDHPPSRFLRLLLAGVLVLFAWGMASSVVEEARGDVATSQTLARASGMRVAANRFPAGFTDLPALPAARVEAEDTDGGDPGVSLNEPRTTIRSRPADPARLPRAPPAAPLLRIA